MDGAPDGTVRIKLLREPTIEWSLIIGDLIHNLRGCLDYATCGLIEIADPSSSLTNIQFPFGRPDLPLNSDERKRVKGLGPEAIARIEAIRVAHGADLHLVNLMSNQDKHRLLLPVAVRQVPMKMTIDKASNTASIEEDIDGAAEVWTKEIKNGEEISMPHMLKLSIGLIIEGEPKPFPLRDIERVNKSVGEAFMMICKIERGLLTGPFGDNPAIPSSGS
ncbi:hypothetical protein J2W92_001870 [Rhizobium leguminosarum]